MWNSAEISKKNISNTSMLQYTVVATGALLYCAIVGGGVLKRDNLKRAKSKIKYS